MDELNKKLAEWKWDRVEHRYGFQDECGNFIEMQSNPYSPGRSGGAKTLCYLDESRDLTAEEQAEYQEDFDKGQAEFIPLTVEIWEKVPDFPHSLDACFEHLVPKLTTILIQSEYLEEEYWAVVGDGAKEYDAGEETPALALCKAIGKLIDGAV